ncbi:MAG: NADH-quinone oxidoreductase subunit NuoN [Gammaproteobacteria bacterium]|nr:MAG: NADH-quinone oxidoreductase subunit NuoN [Gammaproteobacteria bacterium]
MISITDIMTVAPEIFMLTMACLILVLDTFSNDPQRRLTYYLSQLTLVVTAVLVSQLSPEQTAYAFGNSYIDDGMATVLKEGVFIIGFFAFLYSHEYLKEHGWLKGEYFVLGLFAILGEMILISAYSLLTVYLGLELLSLSLYAMVAMHRKSTAASEAAMKYFVLGAMASGMLLYGMSMIYGVTGSLQLETIATTIENDTSNILLVFGLVFVLVGIAFKLGAVPFHMWVPDVYQGSPTCVTLFLASAPKLAAFAMAMRLLVDGLQPMLDNWQQMLIILSILSMATGNIVAISQTNIKRMLAYSAIAHIGFLLLGLLSGTASGYAGSMFYVIIYALMSMGAFGMVILLGRKDFEADELAHFKGLSDRSPWFAFMMLILMFSMAGVPPFLGFWAKWFVLKELVDAGFVWLAATAVFFSIIGVYYYLHVIKLMYFDKADSMTAIKASKQMRFALSVNGLALLILGLMPGALLAICISVMSIAA